MLARLTILVLLLSYALGINAQALNPAALVCANNEVGGDVALSWTIPSNPCGPFVGYEIYASMTEAGPYALLTIIGAELTTTWVHVGANGILNTWYYYIITDYNCPGFTQPSSDTLDNQDPVAPIIDYVTVIPTGVEINWLPSASPETWAYIIYRQTPGFTPIDTVLGRFNTTYIDLGAATDTKAESYSLAALDSCKSLGLFAMPIHNTIFLQATLDPCGDLLLNWNAYAEWPLGIEEHQIWVSVNGGPTALSTTVSEATFNNLLPVNDGDSICVTVRAIRADAIYSESNPVCLRITKVQPSAYLYMRNATIIGADSALIEWYSDPAAAISKFEIESSANSASGYILKNSSFFPIAPPPFLDFTDGNAIPGNFFRVNHVDSCNFDFTSLPARTIKLFGSGGFSLINELQWNAFEIENGAVNSYDIFFNDGSGYAFLTSLSAGTTAYSHDVSSLINANSICYRVVAQFDLDIPSIGVSESLSSSSNEECITQTGKIFIPNALVPNGLNTEFKPVILFGDASTYSMEIYNRSGTLIFQSRDPILGWNGSFNGETVSAGAYGYLIRFTDINGKEIFKKGSVLVVR
ncbi:MAG: gliding motility-associated-like protein [Limisphaerales bacterium]|jgi:gliding motility-associated-like protein